LGVGGDEGVEEGVKGGAVGSVGLGVGFGTEDSAEALGFLAAGSEVGGYLNDDVGFGEVDGCVAYFTDADCLEEAD